MGDKEWQREGESEVKDAPPCRCAVWERRQNFTRSNGQRRGGRSAARQGCGQGILCQIWAQGDIGEVSSSAGEGAGYSPFLRCKQNSYWMWVERELEESTSTRRYLRESSSVTNSAKWTAIIYLPIAWVFPTEECFKTTANLAIRALFYRIISRIGVKFHVKILFLPRVIAFGTFIPSYQKAEARKQNKTKNIRNNSRHSQLANLHLEPVQ